MYSVSSDFKNAIKASNRDIDIKVVVNDTTTYDVSKIINLEIDETLVNADDFTIGTANSNHLFLSLKTTDHIEDKSKIIPSVRLAIETGYTEWVPLGVYYVDNPNQKEDVWSINAYDKLIGANQPYVSALTYPATMTAMLNEICTILGIVKETGLTLQNYTVQTKPTDMTMQKALGQIFMCNAASCRINKDGKLSKVSFVTNYATEEITLADYVKVEKINSTKTITKIVNSYTANGDETNFSAGAGGEENTLYLENFFMNQTILDGILTAINGINYIPVRMDWRAYIYMELGDGLLFPYFDSKAWNQIEETWNEADFRWDGLVTGKTLILTNKIKISKGLRGEITSPSRGKQQSESKYEGVLNGKVNKLDKEALKENKVYYGVSAGRDYGLKIEGTNDTLFQGASDKFEYSADNEKILYFDALKRKMVLEGEIYASAGTFAGSLVAATGTFSGAVNAGSFNGGSININNNFVVPSTGLLQATGANISGVVNITGGSGISNLTDAGELATLDTINGTRIDNYSISSPKILAGAVTAEKMTVTTLSAITANLGTVNAGSLTADTTINVGTDVTIGGNLYLTSQNIGDGIHFPLGIDIYLDPGGTIGVTANFSAYSMDISGSAVATEDYVDNLIGDVYTLISDALQAAYDYADGSIAAHVAAYH
jgi:hypothetical protein